MLTPWEIHPGLPMHLYRKVRGRPSKLAPWQWERIICRLVHGESTSAVAREHGLAKSTISERVSVRVKNLKCFAIQLLETEFSEQIWGESPAMREWLMGCYRRLIVISLAMMRHQHGRRQGRHSEP